MTYCSDECRAEGRRETYRDYRARNNKGPSRHKVLSRQERAEPFKVRVKTVKGVVVLRGKERRAVKMVPSEGDPVIFMEYLTEAVIDTACPPYIRHTFRPITASGEQE